MGQQKTTSENYRRYKVVYSLDVYHLENEGMPGDLVNSILELCNDTLFHVHNPKRNFIGITFPQDRVESLKGLEGVVSVIQDY